MQKQNLSKAFFVEFSEVSKGNVAEVGGKGANLGELTNAGLPVPQGFIITSAAYFLFVERTGLKEKIRKLLDGLDTENSKDLQSRAKNVQAEIIKAKMPEEIAAGIIENYKKLANNKKIYVAVRSSATAEDLPDASFAGQQATFLNVSGEEEAVKAVKECWASLFEARAIYYRSEKGFDHFKVGIAVPVQLMVQSEKSGIMFTIDPVTNDRSKIIIEAGFGLGEAIVLGAVTPDRYIVDKATLQITDKEINSQDFKITRVNEENKEVALADDEKSAQKLTDEEIIKLATLGKKIEEHYNWPQDTEWAIEKGEVFMVQARPVTTIPRDDKKENKMDGQQDISKAEIILKGAAASVGLAGGPIKIIHSPEEIDKILEGDVLVTEMTTPDYVPAMKRASAIVTDKGGRTCHAAIVSRELGIPCVVGTGTATETLRDVDFVTVDGAKGLVYKGKIKDQENNEPAGSQGTVIQKAESITATKIYVNLGEPELATKIAKQNVDGVGLLRAEFIIAENIKEHPKKMIKEGRSQEFIDKLAEGLETFAREFYPRPVVYRATDFKTNEYRNLPGGEEFEPQEENPMIGYRGCFRYIKDPEVFNLELEAIKKVRANFTNLHLMIPFVRRIDEFEEVKKLIEASGLKRSADFKLWIMVEVPSTIFLMDKFCETGIDGISIGSNDLTQLILGLDRDSSIVAEEYDERNEAVQIALKHAIETCRKYGVTASICGQAPSVYPEICEKLVEYGITSLSVLPDVIDSTRKLVASVEEKLLLKELSHVRNELNKVEEKLNEKQD
ncbi:phosphoenolpyruvate synthase [bacterium CG_4_10_14_0_2_um_filter_33_32]|nr:MAG: phosphoenolpyruvate synthase [bacterium CG2_30_33_46]PIR67294.1 MAG: phosphoenolpyruvate synthase [bacterium CG10_big_fil_rev_8_21_14_0_10_33_18]PIU76693.1 MAG: phosphoenolpyruvate synthase [bacterium CG06_land_8_20_14_3_00_33_50]PIW80763.1 MAG: phosphoenolpyruvate synthase [bacterium CG_4_8_14_3_um_filter_33_28]PIY85223.1 MAG: phosphoenolpyruvate synthase [bacterium CG_4_10_14_0_8_um_filter_33_57]PIZ85723.1 MAG: phosphoenolpyruvate synthase [bacterium CG_4_10_14_0_2_um_filter_33_32]P